MNSSFVFYSLGKLLEVLALVMLFPLAIAIGETDATGVWDAIFNGPAGGFVFAASAAGLIGACLVLLTRSRRGQGGMREGFTVVTAGWMSFSVLGAIPLWIHFLGAGPPLTAPRIFRCFTDACFESMSGFTTTGASILADIEALPKSLLFWRAMTNWLGGMGIVTLALIIFPAFGVGAYQMFRGEAPGPSKDRLTPRMSQTAMVLWGIYVALTAVEMALLTLGGMTPFDACCHAFATLATGGFSTKNLSIGAFRSAYIEWVVIAFMALAGMNFMIHYRIIVKRDAGVLRRDAEFLSYAVIIFAVVLTMAALLQTVGIGSRDEVARSFRASPLNAEALEAKIVAEQSRIRTVSSSVRHAAFQTVSILTTTGFCTADFDLWPQLARFLLVMLMFIGGCAGSTAGGVKVIRVIVALKAGFREVRSMIQPRLILPLKVGGATLEEKQIGAILSFLTLFIGLYGACTALLAAMVPDLTTAATAVAACICNIGPGLAGVGPLENYAWIPIPGKWVLIAAMLLGRLEIFTVIIALTPLAWKK